MNKGLKFYGILFSVSAIISFIVMLITSDGQVFGALFMSLLIGFGACYVVFRVDYDKMEEERNKGKQKMISCNKCGHIGPGDGGCPRCGSFYVRYFYL